MNHSNQHREHVLALAHQATALDTRATADETARGILNAQGRQALEALLTDTNIPLEERAQCYLDAPDRFKNRSWSAPVRTSAVLDAYLDHLAYCGSLRGTVDTTHDVEDALKDYRRNPESTMGYKRNIRCDAFIEEILKRNLLSFEM